MTYALQLVAYDLPSAGGGSRGELEIGLTAKWYSRHCDIPTLALEWSALVGRSVLLAAPCEVAVRFWDGAQWVEGRDARFVILSDKWERVSDDAQVHGSTFRGVVSLLDGATVWDAQGGAQGKRQFNSQTPGAIMGTLITDAQARGCLPGLTLGFTSTHDSHGDPWPQIFNRAYGPEVDLWQVLKNLHESGACDFWMEGRTLHLSIPDAGTDYSGSIWLRDAQIRESPEDVDWGSLTDATVLIGDEGARFERTNPAATTPFGRREVAIMAGGVSDNGTAQIMMDRELTRGAKPSRSLTRQWHWHEKTRWMPGRNFWPGDWLRADTADFPEVGESVRIADMAVSVSDRGITAFVTLGTVHDELLVRMAKRQNGIEGGSGVVSMGRPTLPPPPDPTSQWGERPSGFQVDVSAWPIPGGYGGVLGASWDAVTTDTGGFAYTPDGYVVRARRQGGSWMDLFRTSSLSGHAERTDMRPGEVWEAQVAAYRSDQTGVWSLMWSGTIPEDDQAPPTPSQPTGESPPGQLVLTWDGKSNTGGEMPLDTKRVEVSMQGLWDEKWTIPVSGGSFRMDAGTTFQVGDVVEAGIRAVDYAGNGSPWTAPIWVTISAETSWPAAPTSLLASAITYTTSDGLYRGTIDASWAEVTEDIDGLPVDVTKYVVRVRRQSGSFDTDWFDLFDTAGLSGSGSSPLMEVGDVWQVAVAAVSSDGHTGPFSAPVNVTIPPDTIAPPVPSAPIVTSDLGMLTIRWDGLSQSGGGMPADLSHVEVHLTGITEPWLMDKIGRFLHLGAEDGLTLGTIYEVRLKAVDRAGNKSGLSQPASATTVSAISGLQAAVDQVEADFTAADLALSDRIDTVAAASADGKSTNYYGSTDPTPPPSGLKVGDTWFDTGTKTIKVWSGSAWVSHSLSGAQIEALAAAKITGTLSGTQIANTAITGSHLASGSVDVNKLADGSVSAAKLASPVSTSITQAQADATSALTTANGKSKVTYSTATPGSTANLAGDIWWQRDAGGTIIAQWEGMGGTSWTSRPLGNAVIAALDAGKITTGTLNAGRIGANSITAGHIAADAIGTEELAANAVVAGKIAAAQITAAHMVTGTITAASGIIADAAITTAKIADLTVTSAKILALDAAKITTGFLDSARIKTDAAWVQNQLLIGNTDEAVVDPTWQNSDLNASRTRTGWTVAPNLVTHTQAVAEDFYLGTTSDWSDPRSYLPLREGVRYRVEATVRLTTAGQVSLVQRNSNGGYGYISGPVNLAANTDYVLVGEFTWEQYPGSFGVRMDKPGTVKSVSVRPMLSQVLIQDGLISAPKIATNAVTADKINAGAVTALKLSTDALDFKSATGLTTTSGLFQTSAAADTGIKIDGLGSSHTIKAWMTTGQLALDFDPTAGLSIAGDITTTGTYPRTELKRQLPFGSSFSGLRWIPGPGWLTTPWLGTNAGVWGNDQPGSLYLKGGNRDGLTMLPEIALRSGYEAAAQPGRFWPEVDILVGIGSTTHGRRRLRDIGTNKTSIYDWADFIKLETKTGQSIEMPVAGSPGDIRIWSTNGGVLLNAGNGWITTQGIGTSTGGEDIRMEGGWRLVYQTSLSADKLDQQPIGVRYEILELTAKSWIDRVRREQDPAWDVRYGGWIAEDVQAISDAHGGSLAPALIHRDGKLSGLNDKVLTAMLADVVADMERRITELEAHRAA